MGFNDATGPLRRCQRTTRRGARCRRWTRRLGLDKLADCGMHG